VDNLDWSISALPNDAEVERKDGRVGSDLVGPFWGTFSSGLELPSKTTSKGLLSFAWNMFQVFVDNVWAGHCLAWHLLTLELFVVNRLV
jgi:hypothetical protein